MEHNTIVMSEEEMNRSLKRITHEIIERNKGVDNLVLVGIKRRGVPLANIIKDNIKTIENIEYRISICICI